MSKRSVSGKYGKSSIEVALLSSIAILVLLSSFVGVFLSFGEPSGADSSDWYRTVEGVLATDKYTLYPYAKKSLKIGFSKFGEMINALPDQRVGLEYGDRDPFAPPAGNSEPSDIPQRKWFNGWLINITYRHATATPSHRNVWAIAMHADVTTKTYGNGWIRVDNDLASVAGGKKTADSSIEAAEDPADPGFFLTEDGTGTINGAVYGGRKTNGSAVTEPIQVLYDGPRRYVAQLSTTIYDVIGEEEPYALEPLVKITFTIDFNKVKKEVVVIKDVKLLFVKFQYSIQSIESEGKSPHEYERCPHNQMYSAGTIEYQGMYVQFSNRGEWDLGAPEWGYASYAHFYTDGPGEDRYGNLVYSYEGLATVYNREYALIRTAPPNPYARWGVEPDSPFIETFDVAQIIAADLGYVGWAAFWPSLSDWSVDAVTDDVWWRSMTAADPHREDCVVEYFTSPFIVGEWDFILSPAPLYDESTGVEGDVQFRGVTVYGVTDLHKGLDGEVGTEIDLNDPADGVFVGDGDDEDRAPGADNIIDREVYYQLQEVFNPKDLVKATTCSIRSIRCPPIMPEPERHVQIVEVESGKTLSELNLTATEYCPFYSQTYTSPILGDEDDEVGEWFAYSTYAERVLVDGTLLVRGDDYVIEDTGSDTTDRLGMCIVFDPPIEGPARVKVLYSTYPPAKEWIVVGARAATVDSLGAALVSEAFDSLKDISIQWGALDISDRVNGATLPYLLRKFGTGWDREDYYYLDGSNRLALKDDWSTTVPIASAEIVGVGGPEVNLVAEYFNEFSSVIWRGRYQWPLEDLLPVSDWGGNKGNSTHVGPYNLDAAKTGPKGYAVVTVYKDINGTVGFMVWGLTGNDTYWASQAMYNTGRIEWKPGLMIYKELRVDDPSFGGNGNGDLDIKDPIVPIPLLVIKCRLEVGQTLEKIALELTADDVAEIMKEYAEYSSVPLICFLQEENPGVTAIVLEIDYSAMTEAGDFHPTITIVEELGTISEKPQHDP